MQSRLFAKKVIKMIGQGSIWEAFGGDFGACWAPNGSVEQFFCRGRIFGGEKVMQAMQAMQAV